MLKVKEGYSKFISLTTPDVAGDYVLLASGGHAKISSLNVSSAAALTTAIKIKIGNKELSFNGSADLMYKLHDILIRNGNEFNFFNGNIDAIYFNRYNLDQSNASTELKNYYFYNGKSGLANIRANGVFGTGFHKTSSNDTYVLLGGGGHATIKSLFVDNAVNADTLDGYHYTAFPLIIGEKLIGSTSNPIKLLLFTRTHEKGWIRINVTERANSTACVKAEYLINWQFDNTNTLKTIDIKCIQSSVNNAIGNLKAVRNGDTQFTLYFYPLNSASRTQYVIEGYTTDSCTINDKNPVVVTAPASVDYTSYAADQFVGPISVTGDLAPLLSLKRTFSDVGAYIKFMANDANSPYWGIGMLPDGNFTFAVNAFTTSLVKITTDGGITAKGMITATEKGITAKSLNVTGNQYHYNNAYGINLNNSDIINANSIVFKDIVDNFEEGLKFYRTSTTWDTLTVSNGVVYFKENIAATNVAFADNNKLFSALTTDSTDTNKISLTIGGATRTLTVPYATTADSANYIKLSTFSLDKTIGDLKAKLKTWALANINKPYATCRFLANFLNLMNYWNDTNNATNIGDDNYVTATIVGIHNSSSYCSIMLSCYKSPIPYFVILYNGNWQNMYAAALSSNPDLSADMWDGYHILRNTNPDSSTANSGVIPWWIALKGAGYPVYDDPEFANGNNSVNAYNNSNNGAVVITRQADDQNSGNSSGYILKITTTGTASPNRGGFYQTIISKTNQTFIQIFRAKIPVDYYVSNAENYMGTGYKTYWLTNKQGTGKWEWYVRVTICGVGGTFSSGGHVKLIKNVPEAAGSEADVTWYLSYCNVINLQNGKYDGLRVRIADTLGSAYAYAAGKSDRIWHNVATYTCTKSAAHAANIGLYVNQYYKETGRGILQLDIYNNSTRIEFVRPTWLVATGINPDDFVVTYKVDGNNYVFKLWCKCSGWNSYIFNKISEGSWTSDENKFVLNKSRADNSLNTFVVDSLPTDETKVVSTFLTIKNIVNTANGALELSANPSTRPTSLNYETNTKDFYGLRFSLSSSSCTTGRLPDPSDGYVLTAAWDTATGYAAQLGFTHSKTNPLLFLRGSTNTNNNNDWGEWVKVITSINVSPTITWKDATSSNLGSTLNITVGGVNASEVTIAKVRYSCNVNIADVRNEIRTPSYFTERSISSWFNNTGTPLNNWWSGIHVKGWTDTYTSWELAGYSGNTGTYAENTNNAYNGIYYREGKGSVWGKWEKILTDGNINTGLPLRLQPLQATASAEIANPRSGFHYVASGYGEPFKSFHTSNADFNIISCAYSNDWGTQIGLDFRTNHIAVRNKNNGTWNTWRLLHGLNEKIVREGNNCSWLSIQQYDSDNKEPSHYRKDCATINLTTYTSSGFNPWIRAVDSDKSVWTIGTYTNKLYIGKITKTLTENYLTDKWIFEHDKLTCQGDVIASNFKKSGSTDNYVLLGAGGHKLLTDFAKGNAGGVAQPVYVTNGTVTACSSTVGSGTKPVYMNSGTITASSSTVGGVAKPVYMSGGTITACSSTVGSSSLPVYMSGGTITSCTAANIFSALANSGNNISITICGQNRTLEVGYANRSGILSVKDVRDAKRLPNYFAGQAVTAWFNSTGTPDTGWWGGLHVHGWTQPGYAAWELAGNATTTTYTVDSSANYKGLYYREGRDASWGSWEKIITSANIAPSITWTNATSASAGSTINISVGGVSATAKTIEKVRYAFSAGNADTVDSLHANRFMKNYDLTYPGTTTEDTWYTIFSISDNIHGTVLVIYRAYAHSSMTFTVSKGYDARGSITVLNYNSSSNSEYPYIKGVRLLKDGKVQVLINKFTSNTAPKMAVVSPSDVTVNTTLTAYTTTPAAADIIQDVRPSHGMMHAHGFMKNNSSDSYVLLGAGGHKALGDFAKGNAGDLKTPVYVTGGTVKACRIAENGNYFNATYNADDSDNVAKTIRQRIVIVSSSSTTEIGLHLDFHSNSETVKDYDIRLTAPSVNETTKYLVNLPSASGTLALTSQILNPTNYYWANVKVSASSSTTTTPTVKSITTGLNSADGGVFIGNDTNTSIRRLSDQMLLCSPTGTLRFGTQSWDYNAWAGLKYSGASTKQIYLGIPDGTIFNANSALTDGQINFPGITKYNFGKAPNISADFNAHFGGTSGYSGYWKVKILPKTSWMLSFTIRLYQGYNCTDLLISGYNYGTNHWYSPRAIILGSSLNSMDVSFGYDADWELYVAVPAASYTGISIVSSNNGHTQTDWVNGFTITNVSSLSNVQTTVTAYRPWYKNEKVGDADTVDGYHASNFAKGNAGSASKPVYVTGGTVTACTHTLEANVPSNAVFTDTIPTAYCTTASTTAEKEAVCTGYTPNANSYVVIIFTQKNLKGSALTLSINGEDAKPIYINGEVSSNSNKTLPAGTYIAFFDGTNYHFRTDGIIPGKILGLGSAPIIKQGDTVVTNLSANTTYSLNVGGLLVSFKTPADNNDKVSVKKDNAVKAFILGTTLFPSTIATATTAVADTGVYLDKDNAGMLVATTFKGALQGNADTATTAQSATTANTANSATTANTATTASNVVLTRINPGSTNESAHYLVLSTNTEGSSMPLYSRSGFTLYSKDGSTTNLGVTRMVIGNNVAKENDGNQFGAISIASTGTSFWRITGERYDTSNRTLRLPKVSGVLVAAAFTDSNDGGTSGVGSTSEPVYVSTAGEIKKCTSIPYPKVTGLSTTQNTTSLTIKISGANMANVSTTIPFASETQCGIVSCDAQTFNGNKTIKGNIYATAYYESSDERLKTNIIDLTAKDVSNIKFKQFNWKSNNELSYGVIAQEVEKYIPEIVNTDNNGFKSVDYVKLLILKIVQLEKEVQKLKQFNKN